MSVSRWRFGAVALAGLAVLVPQALAQRPGGRVPTTVGLQSSANLLGASINPNFYVRPGLTLNQAAFNTAVLGQAASNIPPYLLGYNPYPQSVNYGPSFPTIAPSMPYAAVSTAPAAYANPYLGGASLTTAPGGGGGYALSTTGQPPGYSPYGYPYGYGSGGGYDGSSYYGAPSEYSGGYLRGLADVTAASGKYLQDVQGARLKREQSRQAALETERRRGIQGAYKLLPQKC